MTTNPELTERRAKIRDRVSAVWERLWEGEGRLDEKHVARWRRAESLITAKERAAKRTVATPPS
jgi:hypothetical protein